MSGAPHAEAGPAIFPEHLREVGGSKRVLEGVAASFAAAVDGQVDAVERDFVVGGRTLRLRAAGAALAQRLSRSFSHLAAPSGGRPDLIVHVWDSASSGAQPPPTPDVRGEQPPGAFFYYSDARVRVGFQLGTSGDPRVFGVYPEAPTPALSVLDTDRAEAWYWVDDAARIPYWEEANPLRFLLDWWLREHGVLLVHAGSVGTSEGGVLFVGKSGSGKSTAALSVLGSDLAYAGDDYVGVGFEPEPFVHSLYSAGKVMADHAERLPALLPALDNADRLDVEKAVVYVHEHWPTGMATGFPLRAILVSRVVRSATEARVIKTSSLSGLSALAPSTVFQMHTRGQDSLAMMRGLVEAVPTYVLELGADVRSIPGVVSGLLEALGAGVRS